MTVIRFGVLFLFGSVAELFFSAGLNLTGLAVVLIGVGLAWVAK